MLSLKALCLPTALRHCVLPGELYTEAADGAMAAMKGRMANKYYALAEEAWAECPDDEEENEAE